jgi:hypothetical protein
MRDLMGLSDKDELIDPEKRIAMSTIEVPPPNNVEKLQE